MMTPSNTSKLVNSLGAFLYQKIDGAYKLTKTSNTSDVYLKISYYDESPKTLGININITTYQDKIRINTIEMSDSQKTLGHDVYTPEQLTDLEYVKSDILSKLQKRLAKNYPHFKYISI